jgi:hypothetical protein
MNFQFVLARYYEDITWVNSGEFPYDYLIYNKGNFIRNSIPIPEKGREAYSYLQHIVRNYDYLADFTAFIQANPFDHCNDFYARIKRFDGSGFYYLTHGNASEANTGAVKDFCDLFLKSDATTLTFPAGEQFIASRERIQFHPHNWYKKMLNYYDEMPQELRADYSGIVERLWPIILDGLTPHRE